MLEICRMNHFKYKIDQQKEIIKAKESSLQLHIKELDDIRKRNKLLSEALKDLSAKTKNYCLCQGTFKDNAAMKLLYDSYLKAQHLIEIYD